MVSLLFLGVIGGEARAEKIMVGRGEVDGLTGWAEKSMREELNIAAQTMAVSCGTER